MHTFTKTMVAAMAMAIGATALPTPAQAGHDHYEKYIKKAIKHRRKAIKHYYKHNDYRYYRPAPYYYSPYHRYRHWDHDRDYDHESFRIYTTPYGGLGFSYSESEGSYW